jgi:hypothetical protein
MRKTASLGILLLAISLLASVSNAEVKSVDFIVFSDVHVGGGAGYFSGSDNITSLQRLTRLMQYANAHYSAQFMVCTGDLTCGWNLNNAYEHTWYVQYNQAKATSPTTLYSLKGNHDTNITDYVATIGAMTYSARYSDIYFIDLSCSSDSADEWYNKGVCCKQYQINAIKEAVASWNYNHSKYHFLFMHFCPYSTWNGFSLPKELNQYYKYFDIIFCGHEGGKEKVFTYGGTLCIKASHLGDRRLDRDTFLTVSINRISGTITVSSQNFMTGTVAKLIVKG